jgi:hypothetical protein
MRPGSIEGPGYWGLDLSVARTFRITENQRVEARAEAYNVTNSMRPAPLLTSTTMTAFTSLNSATFGQVTSAYDPRIMQFALKYIF